MDLSEKEIADIMADVIDRLVTQEGLESVNSINTLESIQGKHKIEDKKYMSGIFVPMRDNKSSGSGDYSLGEESGSRPRDDI